MDFKKRMDLAGWLSIAAAVLVIPVSLLQFVTSADKEGNLGLRWIAFGTYLPYSLLCLYLLSLMQDLFDEYAHSKQAVSALNALLWVGAATITLAIYWQFASKPDSAAFGMAMVSLVLAIGNGALYIRFAIAIAKCPNELFGLKRLLYKLTLAEGICMATVLLMPIAVLISAWSSYIFAKIFFAASRLNADPHESPSN